MCRIEYVEHILQLFVSYAAVVEYKQNDRKKRKQLNIPEIRANT